MLKTCNLKGKYRGRVEKCLLDTVKSSTDVFVLLSKALQNTIVLGKGSILRVMRPPPDGEVTWSQIRVGKRPVSEDWGRGVRCPVGRKVHAVDH